MGQRLYKTKILNHLILDIESLVQHILIIGILKPCLEMVYYKKTREYVVECKKVYKKHFSCNFNHYFHDCSASPDKTFMNEMKEMEESSEEEKKHYQDRIVKI